MKTCKILSLLLALIFSVGILAACGPQGTVGSNTNSTDTHSVTSSESSNTDSDTDSESSDTETENKAADNALPKEYWVEEPGKKYAQNFVVVCMQPSKKGHYDYLVTDFPEAEAIDVCINGWSEFNTVKLALLLKTPSKENVISTIRALEKRDDIYKVTPLYDIEFVPFEFTETTEFTNDYIYCSIQPSAAHRTYTVEDFPELDCVSVEDASWGRSITKRLKIKLKYPSKENVIAAVNLLSTSNREDLYYVCPDIILYPSDAPADATYVANTTSTTEPWEIAKMNLTGAWGITKGSDTVTVGIIDTGIDITHPAMIGRVNTNLSYDFTGAHPGGVEFLDYWHGTAVAGIVGGTWINGGIKGVAPNIQLVSLNVGTGYVSPNTGKESVSDSAIINAVQYATEQGIDILNISINGVGNDSDLSAKIAAFPGLVVCSSGNDNVDCDETFYTPTSFELPNLITVGASTSNDGHWLYYDENNQLKGSNYGDTTIDLYAPGANIRICCFETFDPSGYTTRGGTSYASPYVAGVASLILSANPGMSPVAIKSCILNNADDISALSSRCESGARLNAYNAVSASHPDHYYSTVDNVNHIAYCACGAYIWVHHYTSRYQAINALNHYAYCSCGAYRTQAHTYVASGANQVCTKCNYLYLINKTDPELETE